MIGKIFKLFYQASLFRQTKKTVCRNNWESWVVLTGIFVSVQKLSEYISGRNHLYIQTTGFPPTFKYSKICKLEKSERRKSERNSFLACSFPAALEVRSGEANVYFLF